MRYQTQTFVKQVQVDLLALSDDDLLHTIEQWRTGKEPSGVPHDPQEETWFALGYRRVSHPTEAELEVREYWLVPSPSHLRKLLTEMDVKQFTHHVIALAFRSLHATYPEWGDGSTFNAHFANYLRQIRAPQRRNDLRTKKVPRA
jgi:hypothetical protein